MVDNTTLNPGSGGDVIASDDIGGVKYQRVKINYGADGSATDVSPTTPLPVIPEANSGTGTISALNGAVTVQVDGLGGAAIDVRGTFTGTITFQGTIDGTNWFSLQGTAAASAQNAGAFTTATAAGAWFFQCAGCIQIRAIATAWTSGTATVVVRATTAPSWVWQAAVGGSAFVQAVAASVLMGDVGVQYRANATGAATFASILSPATPAGASIKGSAGRLIGWSLVNTSAGLRSVKIFNATAVTMGTTGAAFEIDIPAGGRAELQLPGGIAMSTGIMWAVTGAKGLTDNTTTGLAANDVSGVMLYA